MYGLIRTIKITLITISAESQLEQMICAYLALRDPHFDNFS